MDGQCPAWWTVKYGSSYAILGLPSATLALLFGASQARCCHVFVALLVFGFPARQLTPAN
ncbi:hypothetical protein GGR57DRAFT_508430 [Xylariaceae sp. FL1272]|nr:hypothetical protein GGR57DRAFT_508430 [Xylariaceae sp. FL1272]